MTPDGLAVVAGSNPRISCLPRLCDALEFTYRAADVYNVREAAEQHYPSWPGEARQAHRQSQQLTSMGEAAMLIARKIVQILVPLIVISATVPAHAARGPAALQAVSPSPIVVSTADVPDAAYLGLPNVTPAPQDVVTEAEVPPNVPADEPTGLLMVGAGLVVLCLFLRKREQKRRKVLSVRLKPDGEKTAVGAPQVQVIED
jgi:hypothetical protein